MRLLVWIIVIFFIFVIFIKQQSSANPCMPLSHFENILASVDQVMVWRGISKDQKILNHLYMDEQGRWSVLRIDIYKNSCLAGSGNFSELRKGQYGKKLNHESK